MKNFKLFEKCNRMIARRVTLIAVLLAMCMPQAWAGVNLAKNSHLDFYVDVSATTAQWKDHVALSFGNGDASFKVPGTHLSHTKLWYCYVYHNWSDLYWMAAYDADWGTGNAGNYSNYSNDIGASWVSAQYVPSSYTINANAVTLVYVGMGDHPTISLSTVNDNRNYDYMNYTIDLESYVKEGAADYSKANAKGTVSAGSYRIYGDQVTTESTSASLSTSQNTTSIRCARTAETSFSVGTPSSGYEFVGWYDGNGDRLSSATEYTDYNPSSNATVRAYFAQTHTVNVSAGAHGSVSTSGNKTIGQKGLSVTATADTYYVFDEWVCTGGASVADASSETTTITATADGTVTAKFVSKWNIKGSESEMGSWSTCNPLDYVSGTTFRGTIELAASTTYEFKVFDWTASGDAAWYGYNTGGSYTTFTRAGTHTQSGLANNKNNLKITTDGAGVYTFEFNTTSNVITVYYPPIVTYHNNGAAVGHNTAPTDATYYTSGDVVTVKDNTGLMTCSTSGKVFAGWDTSSSATTVVYDPADSEKNTFLITADVDLYPVWKPGYYLISLSGSGSDGTKNPGSGPFMAPQNLSSKAYTVNDVCFSKSYYQYGGTGSIKGTTNQAWNKYIFYDTETTETSVYVYAWNKNSSAESVVYNVIAEGESTEADQSESIPAGEGKLIRIDASSDKGARVGISVTNNTNLLITQIKVVEYGTTLPLVGEKNYELAFPGRPYTVSRSGTINGVSIVGYDNISLAGSAQLKLRSGSYYVSFTTDAATQLLVTAGKDGVDGYVCTDYSNASRAAATGVAFAKNTTTTINLNEAGTYYITGSSTGDNTYLSKIAFDDFDDCTEPTAFSHTAVTSNSVTLSITDGEDTGDYEFYYSTSSTTPNSVWPATTTSTSKTPTIGDLVANTTYYIWVRSKCSESSKSDWVALSGDKFKTDEESCTATIPGNISKGTASGGTGTITLTAAGSPASNNTWYWQTASDGTSTTSSGTTYDVSEAGTYYIRSYCSTGSGCWSDAKSVTVVAADLLTSISPTLSYPSSVTVGGSTISPTLEGNSGSGSVSYALNSVSPSGSLTIDSETGVVTGVTASGTATVTATISANGNYAGGSATSSTITVRATPSVSSFTPASGSTIKTGTTITVAGSSSSTVYCLWASSSKTASQIQEGTAGTSGAATVTSAGIASANGTTLYAVATEGGATSSVSSASYTIDDTAPTLSSSDPDNGDTGVEIEGTIVLTFSEALGSVDDTKFTLTNATKGAVAIDGSDNTKVNIAYSGADYSTTVTLATAAGAVADAAGNTSAALSSISFTTKPDSYDITEGSHSGGTIAIKDDEDNTITTAKEDDKVYITATPSTGYRFTSWTITKTSDASDITSSVSLSGLTAEATFTMPAYGVTVNATFAAINYAITHNAAENGTYTISVAGGSATSESTTANYNQTVTLAATPSSHYKLQAWNVTKTSSGDEITVTDNEFTMPAEAVTIAPTFGRVYTVSFYTHGGSSQASIEQSTVGGAITMPTAPTYAGHEFVNWVIGGETFDPSDPYTPTADITAHATWKATCAGGGGDPTVLFSQDFDDATAIAYGYTSGSDPVVHTYNVNAGTPTTLSGLVGSGTNLFTSLASSIKQGDIALNTKNGGNSVDVSGFFQAYAKGNNTAYWSLTRTTDFAATAPKALQVSMDIWYCNGSSGNYQAVQFAIGDGFTDALSSTTAQANSNVHSGFGIKANSTATLTAYGDKSTNIYSTGITQSTWLSITWVINNTGSDLTYNNPTGSGTTTLANDKFDIWLKTQAGAASTYTKVVSAQAAITEGKDLQNIYIGHNVDGKQHEFRLDNIVVTDISSGSGSTCYYITYNGNGADAGYVNDDRAYSSGDNVYVSTNSLSSNFSREGYEFNGWNNKPDGSGTYYNYWTNSDKVVITKDTTLYAQWKIVVDEDNENLSGFETPQYKDVVVRNGAKLTITQNMSVRNITVESGSTLHVAKNGEEGITLSIDSLSLVGGYYMKKDYSQVYDMPRVYIDPLSTLLRTNSTINFDIAVTNNFHPIAVPFPVKVSDVKYTNESLRAITTYGTHYLIKTYDGAARANGSYACWTFVSNRKYNEDTEAFEDTYLQPGRGYILAAIRGKGDPYAFIRFPMKSVDDEWTTLGEQGTVDDVTKNVVAVEAYLKDGDADGSKTPNANKGWNILGVPFMSRYQATDDIIQSSTEIIQGHFDYSTNEWVDDKIRYVTVPTYDFTEYNQYSIEDEGTVLLPGWCFFVQVETSGNLKFLSEAEAEAAKDQAMPIYAPRREQEHKPTVKTGIILSGADASDKTTIIVSDKYNAAEYEINADLEKMFGDNGYTLATYTLSSETRLAYNAMSNADVANIIPIGYRAPADGEYTFSINPRYAENGAFEHVNLIDYETGLMTDLLMGSYTFSTERTQLDTRFALNVVPRRETPTDIENGASGINDANSPRKVLINDKMYIIIDGKMYDATGKAVK